MNIERLNNIIDIYINKFEFLTNNECDENMKWRAIYHFKKNFDINAQNFYDMFKFAMSESSIIINNGTVQPVNGILRLISHEEDTMRGLFAMLFADDGGDIDKRQEKIEHFVDETNKLLEKYERGKWKYKQDFRSVLAYLTFFKPEENYLYKSSQCQPFFRYLEFGDEIGYGQYFKLSRYYRMCDEVREAIANHESLMQIHSKRWEMVDDPADNLHILTFDIIYCSIVYSFYKFEDYSKVIRKSKSDLEQEKIEAQIALKRDEISELTLKLEKERSDIEAIPEIYLVGQEVKHKLFGFGKVIQQSGSYIEVEFSSKTSKFILTTAFAGGFLVSADSSILERCKLLELKISICSKIEKDIKAKTSELFLLESKLK